MPCTFHDSSPVILPRLRRAGCYSDHGFGPLSSICESPPVATPKHHWNWKLHTHTHTHTHLFTHTQTTLQELRASVSTVVHRIKEDFKLVGRLAITWSSCVCTIFYSRYVFIIWHTFYFSIACVSVPLIVWRRIFYLRTAHVSR